MHSNYRYVRLAKVSQARSHGSSGGASISFDLVHVTNKENVKIENIFAGYSTISNKSLNSKPLPKVGDFIFIWTESPDTLNHFTQLTKTPGLTKEKDDYLIMTAEDLKRLNILEDCLGYALGTDTYNYILKNESSASIKLITDYFSKYLGNKEIKDPEKSLGYIINQYNNRTKPYKRFKENKEVQSPKVIFKDTSHKFDGAWFPNPIPYIPTEEELKHLWRDSYFRIGYAAFNLPPENITTMRNEAVEIHPLLRSKGGLKKGFGNAQTDIQIRFTLDNTDAINNVLLPIIRQFEHTPFVPVVNQRLNYVLDIDALSLEAIQISTTPGFPNSLTAVINASKFNWNQYLTLATSFDDSICYPLFKRWCETKTDTQPIGKMDGKVTFYIPSEESLRLLTRYNTALRATVQTELGLFDSATYTPVYKFLIGTSDDNTSYHSLTQSDGYWSGDSLTFWDSTYDQRASLMKIRSVNMLLKFMTAGARVYYNGGGQTVNNQTTNQLGIQYSKHDDKLEIKSAKLPDNKRAELETLLGDASLYLMKARQNIQTSKVEVNNQLQTLIDAVESGAYYVYLNRDDVITKPPFGSEEIPNKKYQLFYDRAETAVAKSSGLRKKIAEQQENIKNLKSRVTQWERITIPTMIVENIMAGFTNNIAKQQPNGQEEPIQQFVGSGETYISLNGVIEDEEDVILLRELLEKLDYLARHYAGVGLTEGYDGYMMMDNEIARLLGCQYVLPLTLKFSTVEGFPTLHSFELTLVKFDVGQRGREKLQILDDPKWYLPTGDREDQNTRKPRDEQTAKIEMSRDDMFDHRIRSSYLQEKLRSLELYPDMKLPTFDELKVWTSDAQLYGYSQWTAAECQNMTPVPVPNSRAYADPDFYCVPGGPYDQYLIDHMMAHAKGTRTPAEFGALQTNDPLTDNERNKGTVKIQAVPTPENSEAYQARVNKAQMGYMETIKWAQDRGQLPYGISTPITYKKAVIPYNEKIIGVAAEMKFSPNGIKAVLAMFHQEGGVTDTKGASKGLGQLEYATAKSLGLTVYEEENDNDERLNPEKAIPAATRYFKGKYEATVSLLKEQGYNLPEDSPEVWAITGGMYNHPAGTRKAIRESSTKTFQGINSRRKTYLTEIKKGDPNYLDTFMNIMSTNERSETKKIVTAKTVTELDKLKDDEIKTSKTLLEKMSYAAAKASATGPLAPFMLTLNDFEKALVNRGIKLELLTVTNNTRDQIFTVGLSNQFNKIMTGFETVGVVQPTERTLYTLAGSGDTDTAGGDYWGMDRAFYDEETHEDMFYDMRYHNPIGRLVKAFPTYCLLLVDGGRWIRFWRLYDRWYGMHAIQSIEVHKTRKSPVDTAVINFSNVFGNLTKKSAEWGQIPGQINRWGLAYVWQSLQDAVAPEVDNNMIRARAQHVNSLFLKAGSRLHVRLGYCADASKLPVTFNGVISEVPVAEDSVQVVALGDGIELVRPMVPPTNLTEGGAKYKQVGFMGSGLQPRNAIMNVMCPIGGIDWMTAGWFKRENPYGIEHFGSPQYGVFYKTANEIGMNVYRVDDGAVSNDDARTNSSLVENYANALGGLRGFSDSKYLIGLNVDNATPWEVIRTCTKAVPDYICAVHPFDLRSTLFYGKPQWPVKYQYKPTALKNPPETEPKFEDICYRKPFRQVHLITSELNLIANKIKSNADSVYTICQAIGTYNGVFHRDGIDDYSSKVYLDTDIFPEFQKLLYVKSGLYTTDLMKANDALGSFDVTTAAFTRDVSNNFAISSLKEVVKDMYEGHILILGNPSIKPYDIVYLSDMQTLMTGNIEVKEITQHLSQDTGFVTTVTPDLLCASMDTHSTYAWAWLKSIGQRLAASVAMQQAVSLIAKKSPIRHTVELIQSTVVALRELGEEGSILAKLIEDKVQWEKVKKVLTQTKEGAGKGWNWTKENYKKVKDLLSKNTDDVLDAIIKYGGTDNTKGVVQNLVGTLKENSTTQKLVSQADEWIKTMQGKLKETGEFLKKAKEAQGVVSEYEQLGKRVKDIRKELAKPDLADDVKTKLLEEIDEIKLKRLDMVDDLKDARVVLKETKTVLSNTLRLKKIANIAKIVKQGWWMVAAQGLVNWLNRFLAFRQALILNPLLIDGKPFVAGITGHAGCVIGESQGAIDAAIASFLDIDYQTTKDQNTMNFYNYGGINAGTIKSLVGLSAQLFGIQAPKNEWEEEDITSIIGPPSELNYEGFHDLTGDFTSTPSAPVYNKVVADGHKFNYGTNSPHGTKGHGVWQELGGGGTTALDIGMGRGNNSAAGQNVYALYPGKVTTLAHRKGLGYHMFIEGNNISCVYEHINPTIQQGAMVATGQVIGQISGELGWPHLHLEVAIAGTPVSNAGLMKYVK